MTKTLTALACVAFAAVALVASAGSVELRDRSVFIDGRKTRILAGTMHYFRVPRACWRERMEKGKAMGLNAIETYVCWNLHERERGKFDFSDNLDLEAYLKLAQELGLYVILRPGPYICSEWDNGGLPAWLMTEPGIRFRRMNGPYLRAVDAWFAELLPRIVRLDHVHGGPVIAIQLENEYGSYAGDKEYLAHLRDLYLKAGFRVPFFCADGADEPFLCAEFWIGWFDTWGRPHKTVPVEQVTKELKDILAADET